MTSPRGAAASACVYALALALFVVLPLAARPRAAEAVPRPKKRPPTVVKTVNGRAAQGIHDFLEARAAAADGFSGSILVAVAGKVVLCHGYGFADRAAEVPVTIATLFDIGALAKQFTAAAILQLEADGKLRTTDPIGRHLKGVPAAYHAVTIAHLATETAGVPEKLDFAQVNLEERDAVVKHILQAPLAYAPGEKCARSDYGYCLLAAIVEAASGERFENYLRAHIFLPAGMTSTAFRRDPRLDPAKCARGYDDGGADKGPGSQAPYHWGIRGAAGILSTPADLYRWEVALKRGRVLPEEAVERMFHPFKDDHAYAWQIGKSIRGTQQIFLDGAAPGFEAHYRRLVGEEILIVMTLNCTKKLDRTLHEVEKILFKDL